MLRSIVRTRWRFAARSARHGLRSTSRRFAAKRSGRRLSATQRSTSMTVPFAPSVANVHRLAGSSKSDGEFIDPGGQCIKTPDGADVGVAAGEMVVDEPHQRGAVEERQRREGVVGDRASNDLAELAGHQQMI